MHGMKTKTIRSVMRMKLERWAATLDPPLRQAALRDALVCGGAVSSMLMGERVNDYDLYIKNPVTLQMLANHYASVFNMSNKLKSVNEYDVQVADKEIRNIQGELERRITFVMRSAGVASENQDDVYDYFECSPDAVAEAFVDGLKGNPMEAVEEVTTELADKKKPPFRPVFFSDNAVTLSDKVQLVVRFHGKMEEIHCNFDFVHSMCGYDYEIDHLYASHDAMASMLSKDLEYRGSLYPLASMFRMRKFMARGWRITAGQMLKIAWQLNELDLSDMDVLNEQLMGVDRAYMKQLIDRINSKDPKQKVDSAYVALLVDEVFS